MSAEVDQKKKLEEREGDGKKSGLSPRGPSSIAASYWENFFEDDF